MKVISWNLNGVASCETITTRLTLSQLVIPNELLEKTIPDNAAFELEQFFKYIV